MREAALPPVERCRLSIGDNSREAQVRHARSASCWNGPSLLASEEETERRAGSATTSKWVTIWLPRDVAGNSSDGDGS